MTKIVIETDELPAEEGSIGRIRIIKEGIGEIKNNKIVVRKSEIAKIEFIGEINQSLQAKTKE